MNWKQYEKEILVYFQQTYPNTSILFDQKVVGKYSKVERQIDILIEGEIAGYSLKIVVDCKHFTRNIDVKQVESFCSMVEDVEAHQGVLITQKGYSPAAINRAFYGNHKVELDIINFDEIKDFQAFVAVPYSGHFSVMLPAPFGWVFDLKDKINSFASLFQRGLTLVEAMEKNEWMYVQFWKKDNCVSTIEELIEEQNSKLLHIDPKAKFSYNSKVKRKDGFETKIRIADLDSYPALEVTGLIQFEKHIFFIVLFTPKELLYKNMRKLQYLLTIAEPFEIEFDNHKVIKQYLTDIELINDSEKKSDMYHQVGNWYKEMDNDEKSLIYFKKSLECFPTHYKYLKHIINETLSLGKNEESLNFASQLFEIKPESFKVAQNLSEIFLNNKKTELIIDFFQSKIEQHNENEVLGNLNFFLGLVHYNIGKVIDSFRYFELSKAHFKKVFPDDHEVFKSISLILEERNRE